MSPIPRIAVGTIQSGTDGTAVEWGLMELLERSGWRVQSFLSRGCFAPRDGATPITGQPPRHLDSWLMPRELCARVLQRGAQGCDVAVISGRFDCTYSGGCVGGSLDTLCHWLDVPRIAVVNVAALGQCRLPARPQAEAIILDEVGDGAGGSHWRTTIEGLWGLPVLGSLGRLPSARRELARIPLGARPPAALCRFLGEQLASAAQVERLRKLAQRPGNWPDLEDEPPARLARPVRVALAYDDAFHCYFPDALELVESHGAQVCDFSPLKDERLPDADVLYFGCGRPDLFAEQLAANHCLKAALRSRICSGQRVYAEGGGLAYLGQWLLTPDGRRLPMAAALPLATQMAAVAYEPVPDELTLSVDSWLSPRGTTLRGYRNPVWEFLPELTMQSLSAAGPAALWQSHAALGSSLHVNFAAQAGFMQRFLLPETAGALLPSPWR